jgi:hypothetical protein
MTHALRLQVPRTALRHRYEQSGKLPHNKALELTAFSVPNVGNFHRSCAIIARTNVIGGSSAWPFGGLHRFRSREQSRMVVA